MFSHMQTNGDTLTPLLPKGSAFHLDQFCSLEPRTLQNLLPIFFQTCGRKETCVLATLYFCASMRHTGLLPLSESPCTSFSQQNCDPHYPHNIAKLPPLKNMSEFSLILQEIHLLHPTA